MASSALQVGLRNRPGVPPIVMQAGMEASMIQVCAGQAAAGCLVSLPLRVTLAGGASNVRARIDPLQPVVPLALVLSTNADLSFEIFSGWTNKTIPAEGTGITGIYTPGDFPNAKLIADINALPPFGTITKERPSTLVFTNADAVNPETTTGRLIGIAADKQGRIPTDALLYHLKRLSGGNMWGSSVPQFAQLCARGFRVVGGYAKLPEEYCDGQFAPGTIVPLKLLSTALPAGVATRVRVGPLNPMVPVVFLDASTGAPTFQTLDPATGKTADIEGGDDLASPAPTGSAGSALNGTYLASDFTLDALHAGANPFPINNMQAMTKERELTFVATSTAGGTFAGFVHAIATDGDGNVPELAWEFAMQTLGGQPAGAPA